VKVPAQRDGVYTRKMKICVKWDKRLFLWGNEDKMML